VEAKASGRSIVRSLAKIKKGENIANVEKITHGAQGGAT
jgi:hypothetical protein